MALSVQNLRAVGTGVEPVSLLPGQIAFNVTDKVLYVGDETATKTSFDGSSVPGVTGGGWYSMPMDFESLAEYYVPNPQFYGDTPVDQQVLTWSSALNHPIWTNNGGGGGGNQVYILTNAEVAAAPGATTSAKITAALGLSTPSPDEGDVCIVTGLPDDVYEGLYFYTTEWVKGAAYAYPSASEVIYNNTGRTLGATVQFAIDDLDDGLIATTAIANTANSTANSALSIASAALPRAGGTMTGTIVAQNINVQTGYGVQFNAGANGTINGINDSVNAPSSTVAASSTALKTAYDLAAAAVPRSSYTTTGDLLYGTGAGTFTDLPIGTPGQVLIVGPGNTPIWVTDVPGDVTGVNATFPITVDNTDPQQPVIGINGASTAAAGAVQLSDSVSSTSSLRASTPFATKIAYDAAVAAQATADAAIPRASYTTQGDLLVGTGAGTFGPLAVGTLGQILVVGPGGSPQWEDDAPGDVTSVTGSAPITVNNADPENPVVGVNLATTATPGVVQIELTGNLTNVGGVINVPDASTTVKGAVQLNNTLSSDSTSEALAAAQGKALQLQIDALTLSNSVFLSGGYDATTGLVDGVTSQGTLAGFVDGAAPPAADATTVDHYLICVVAGNVPSAMENGDWLLAVETSPGVYAYQVLGVGSRPASASYTTAGIVQLANAAAVLAGTSDTLAITPQALQDNVLDSVTTANSSQIASSTAAKTAYDAGILGQTEALAAQATANAALPKAGGTMTGTINAHNVNIENTYSLQFAGGTNGSLNAVTDLTNVTSSTTAASATAVKAAYDAGVLGQTNAAAAQATADAALPKSGGTMTGNITFQDAGEGVVFSGGSSIIAISDATGNTNSDIAASSTAVKNAYALADAALPKAGGTMTGDLTFSGAGLGVVFNNASTVEAISDSVSTVSSTTAASSTAVKAAYDAAIAAQTNGPLTSDTVLYVNCTDGNDLTAARGTDRPYATIAAALAAASEGDTILLSPGTFTESFTISKGVNISGTYSDQATWSGTKIIGNVVVNLVGAGVIRNLAVSDIYFISTNSTSPMSVTGMSPGAGGINTFTNCTFTQQLVTDTAQFAFQTSGTWTRTLYLRNCSIDGNFKHNAGTTAGASGYIVIDSLLGIGNNTMYHYILTGTVEYRNPSNTLASIFQTGGVALINNASSGITANGATTSAVFGGTGFSYKGTAAAAGAGTIYFQGGSNQGTGKVDIGANVIYGWTNLAIDPANLTVNVAAIAYTTAVPAAANAQAITQQRPRLDLLKTASTVTAANQLGTVIDLTTGTIYSVTAFDAGTY